MLGSDKRYKQESLRTFIVAVEQRHERHETSIFWKVWPANAPMSITIKAINRDFSYSFSTVFDRLFCHFSRWLFRTAGLTFFVLLYLLPFLFNLCTLSTTNVASILNYLNVKELARFELFTGFQSKPQLIEDWISYLSLALCQTQLLSVIKTPTGAVCLNKEPFLVV